MGQQTFILLQQAHHGTHYTQVPPSTAARGDTAQQGHCPRASRRQQLYSQTHHYQQCQGKQGKYPRPGVDVFDAGLGKAQLPLGIAKALLTPKPPRVLRCGRVGPAAAIGDQVPRVPLALVVARPTQRDPQAVRGTGTIGPPSQSAPTRIAGKAQGAEWTPLALKIDLGAALDPNDELQ